MKKVKPNGGTLSEFTADYMELSGTDGITVNASTLFPIMQNGTSVKTAIGPDKITYEWVIYYDENPNKDKLFRKSDGAVVKSSEKGIKVDMTEKEGNAMQEEVVEDKKEMKVII